MYCFICSNKVDGDHEPVAMYGNNGALLFITKLCEQCNANYDEDAIAEKAYNIRVRRLYEYYERHGLT